MTMVLDIAVVVVIVGEMILKALAPSTITKQITHLEIKETFHHSLRSNHWIKLTFFCNNKTELEEIFLCKFPIFPQDQWKDLEEKKEDSNATLIEWVSDKVDKIVPGLNFKFWINHSKKKAVKI